MRFLIVLILSIIAPAIGIEIDSGFFWSMFLIALTFDVIELVMQVILFNRTLPKKTGTGRW